MSMESDTAPSYSGPSNMPSTATSYMQGGSQTGDVEESKATSPGKIIADPRGDIIFLVGPDDNRTSIQVSSKALSLASPVFRAMFGSGFLEGTPTDSGVPRTVALPDDDPAAMSILCYILHFQFDQDSLRSTKVFESLALLVDKYQCAQAVKPWTASWIQRWPGSPDEADYFNMIYIAYAFDLPEVFHRATLNAFCDASSTEVLEMEKTLDGARILPASLYPSIYRRQRDILDSFHSHFVRAIKPFLDYAATTKEDASECVCDRAAKIGSYFISLTSLGLWPSHQKISFSTLAGLLDDIERVTSRRDTNSMVDVEKCNGSSCKMDFHNVLREVVQETQKLLTGLCLTCVKAGRVSPEDGNCQRAVHNPASLGPPTPRWNDL